MLVLAGCAGPYLSRIDTTGRDPARVEEDKLACTHEAQQRMTWGQFGAGVAFGPLGSALYETRSADGRERQARVEHMGEACMVRRGYKLQANP